MYRPIARLLRTATPIGFMALAVLALPSCSLLGDAQNGKAGAESAGGQKGGGEKGGGEKGGSKGGEKGGGGGNRTPSVMVGTVKSTDISDRVEALGTANANEQADLNSTVTERIAKINFDDGAYVPKGAVIAELVRTEQGASLKESEARLREAESQLQRLRQLQKQGFATNARVEEQQATVDIARAQGAGARSQIGDRVIRAPFSGWLSLRRISPGAVVNAGTTVATIVDHSRIKLDFPVPETYLAALRPGLEIEAKAAAFPGEIFRGKVASIDPLVDPVTRAATARAVIPNPDLRLRPGMLMTVEVRQRPRTALVVPELAVVGEGSGAYVWKVSAENEADRQEVTTGTRREGQIEILTGLAEGDRIVTEGTVKLRGPGPIKPVEARAAAGKPAPGQPAPARGDA